MTRTAAKRVYQKGVVRAKLALYAIRLILVIAFTVALSEGDIVKAVLSGIPCLLMLYPFTDSIEQFIWDIIAENNDIKEAE